MSSIRGDIQISRNTSTRSLRVETNVLATSASTLHLTVYSHSTQIFIGTVPGQIVQFPDSSVVEVGQIYWIRNRSATMIRLIDYSGSDMLTLMPYQTAFMSLQNGVWAWSVDYELQQGAITTLDENPLVIQTLPVPKNSLLVLETKILGIRKSGILGAEGDSAAFFRTARLSNVENVVRIAQIQSSYTSVDQPSWNATLAINGTDIDIIVSGSSGNTVSWAISTVPYLTTF